MTTKKKNYVTIISGVLLVLLYGIIFSFSAQDARQSEGISRLISRRCAELINSLSGGHWSDAVISGFAEYFEHPLRKLAHFSEYACMGILVYVLWSRWMRRGRGLYLLTVGWVFLSGCADELHQLFVPGRYASFADVLLDTFGGVFGVLFCICAAGLRRRRSERKQGGGRASVTE